MQQALALFRTQRIVKIYLELDSSKNKLIAEISADNGEPFMKKISLSSFLGIYIIFF